MGKVSGLSAGLVWARSLVCQQVWCGQGLWFVSRSGVGKVSGETMISLHTHTQVVMTTEVEYLIPSMIVAYGHVSPMHGDQEQYWGRRGIGGCSQWVG